MLSMHANNCIFNNKNSAEFRRWMPGPGLPVIFYACHQAKLVQHGKDNMILSCMSDTHPGSQSCQHRPNAKWCQSKLPITIYRHVVKCCQRLQHALAPCNMRQWNCNIRQLHSQDGQRVQNMNTHSIFHIDHVWLMYDCLFCPQILCENTMPLTKPMPADNHERWTCCLRNRKSTIKLCSICLESGPARYLAEMPR